MEVSVPGDGEVELVCCGADRASKCRPPSPPAPISQYGIPRPRLRIHEFGLRRARNLNFFPQIGGQLWRALPSVIGCLSASMWLPPVALCPGCVLLLSPHAPSLSNRPPLALPPFSASCSPLSPTQTPCSSSWKRLAPIGCAWPQI